MQPPQSFLATMEEYIRDAPRVIPVAREVLVSNNVLLDYTLISQFSIMFLVIEFILYYFKFDITH